VSCTGSTTNKSQESISFRARWQKSAPGNTIVHFSRTIVRSCDQTSGLKERRQCSIGRFTTTQQRHELLRQQTALASLALVPKKQSVSTRGPLMDGGCSAMGGERERRGEEEEGTWREKRSRDWLPEEWPLPGLFLSCRGSGGFLDLLHVQLGMAVT
jgi:hypothetical protein